MPTVGLAPLLAESSRALITWTPATFYVAAALLQVPIIYGFFSLMHADSTHNTLSNAVLCAGVGNLIAFTLRHYGIFGVLGTVGAYFLMLVAISGLALFRSMAVLAAVSLFYAGSLFFVVARTPLTPTDIGGYPRILAEGEVESSPMDDLTEGELERETEQ